MPPLEWNAAIVRNDGAGAASVADVGRKKLGGEVELILGQGNFDGSL